MSSVSYPSRCPSCRWEAHQSVLSTRTEKDGTIRRRRRCVACGFRYTTYESQVKPGDRKSLEKLRAYRHLVLELRGRLAKLGEILGRDAAEIDRKPF